ncbi:uncharacterized protein LOC119741631 [Patiria miniata]|nr:uncharacterized protein LOC119741631 [Patiria miniata]
MIAEAAHYYTANFPNISSSSEYHDIGKKMHQEFPAIAREGEHAWSFFTKCLSQRIRHMRWASKKKTVPPKPAEVQGEKRGREDTNDQPRKSVRGAQLHISGHKSCTDAEYEEHLKELASQWDKGETRNVKHIKLLLSETFRRNEQWIRTLPDSQVHPILEKIPCYEDGAMVMHDFQLLLGETKFQAIQDNIIVFMDAVEKIMESKTEEAEPERMIPIISYVEKATAFEKGKGRKTRSIITMKEDIPDGDIKKELHTPRNEPPKLVIFTSNNKLQASFVVADGVSIMSEKGSTATAAILLLIGVYYLFDLEYPKTYSQLLGTLQNHVVKGVPYDGQKSAKFRMFQTALQRKLKAVAEN